MSTEDLFKKAMERRKKEKEQEKQGGVGFETEFEMPEHTALGVNQFKLLRFLGEPISMRQQPTSPKVINHSMIVGDDDKKFRVIWPDKREHPDWILWRIYSKVMAYTYDQNSKTKMFHHSESHPTVFNRVSKNGQPQNKYEQGWKPTQFVIWNVIDRTPEVYQWHKENQKTLLLSKKGSEMKNGGIFYEPGVPVSLYNTILDEIVEVNGDWNTYDVFVMKMDQDPWYKAYHAVDDYKRVAAKEDDMEKFGYDPQIVERPLTDEELSWEMYDIDKMFPVTSYQKIYNRLGTFIQSVDKAFNTNYYKELEEKKEEEKKERENSNVEEAQEKAPTTTVTKEKEIEGEEKEEEEKPERPTRRAPKEEAFDLTPFDNDPNFKGMDKLTPEMREKIVGYNEDKGTFEYDTTETIYACINADECSMESPESFTHCPLCGAEF